METTINSLKTDRAQSGRAGSTPTRTCVATGKKFPQSQLLRVVADRDDPCVIVPDPGRTLPGRGAWITPSLHALELAVQRRAFVRALRMVSTPVDAGPVRKYLEELAPPGDSSL